MKLARVASLIAAVMSALASGVTILVLELTPGAENWPVALRLACAAILTGLVIVAVTFPLALRGDRTLAGVRRAVTEFGDATFDGRRLPQWLRRGFSAELNAIERRCDIERKLRDDARNLEVQLRVSESCRRQLEAILHSLRDVVIVTDAFNEIVLANEAAGQMLGFDPAKSRNQQVGEFVSHEQVLDLIQEARESGNPAARRTVELTLPDAEGRPCIFETLLSTLGDRNENVTGVVTLMRDVTREREISQMKSDFVSKASHELRTPLSSIKAYIEMLIDGEAASDDDRLDFYQIIQTEAERLDRLIDNMLNISRIEAGIIQVEWLEVDVADLVEEVVAFTQPQANEKEITLTAKRSQSCCKIVAGSDLLRQVITNLVSNAIKYTPEGGRVVVSTELTDCDHSVLVSVADTGLGIPPDALPHLFDKFYRIDNYKRVAKGTGLGLNLVKQIVEKVHHGEIGVESRLGMGSKFWFSIPCQRAGGN